MPGTIENLPAEGVTQSGQETVQAQPTEQPFSPTAPNEAQPVQPAQLEATEASSVSAFQPTESAPSEPAGLTEDAPAILDTAIPALEEPTPATESLNGNGNGAHNGSSNGHAAATTTKALPLNLSGKVALVTGSSRGIGRGIALELAERGASLVINYCGNIKAANSVVQECKELGVSATAIQADVSKFEDIQSLYKQALEFFGHIDIVVSNSGVEHFSSIEETTPEMYDYVFNINTRGQFFVAQQGYLNISHGGRIIMMSSVAANIRGLADHAIYSASKAAIEAMVRSFPSDFSPKRVTVNAIAPAGIQSDMASANGWRYFPGGTPNMPLEVIAKSLSDHCPLKRFGQPKDVARVVAFLASEEGGWINGQTLGITGGSGK